jgi:hypothetical protein
MSLTKRFMEMADERDALVASLKALIEHEKLTNGASIGIAKLVIDKGTLDVLSDKQRDVFNRFIAPHLQIECEQCETPIHASAYPEVMQTAKYEGQVLCESCLHMRNSMRKDD